MEVRLQQEYNEGVDRLQTFLENMPQLDYGLRHVFTPGIYLREMTIPANAIVVSKIHKTRHPFVLLRGKILVIDERMEPVLIEAPYQGISEAGTRRIGISLEECVWSTIHANPDDGEDLAVIEDRVIEKHEISAAVRQEMLAAATEYLETKGTKLEICLGQQ